MAKQDYYHILGVARDASEDDLKKAYRKLAMKYHPDRNPGDKEAERQFKELNEAYDVLKDDQKRAAYDRFGHAAFEHGGGSAARRRLRAGFGGGFADIFEEMFGDFVGGRPGGGGRPRGRGADLRYNLRDHAGGGLRRLEEDRSASRPPSRCEACNGSGAPAARPPETCSDLPRRRPGARQQGFFTVERTCPTCGGSGQIIRDPCRSAAAPAGCSARRRCRSPSPPASRTAPASACRRGRGRAARRPGGRPLHLRQHRRHTASSSATAPTSSAACRCR